MQCNKGETVQKKTVTKQMLHKIHCLHISKCKRYI